MANIKVIQVVNDRGIPFHVRLIRKGDFYGANMNIKHKEDEPLIEFYDTRFVKGFTILGQFVSRYLLSTLVNHVGVLSLHGTVDDWYITGQNMKSVNQWLVNIKPFNRKISVC
jgi:hypothetical protein